MQDETHDPATPPRTESGAHDETLAAEGHAVAERPLERGARLGRYVVLDVLGFGGMGIVYAAWDPELDRKVALKLLRAGLGDTHATSGASMRLLREAQAMARLSHPNVITVHDVGTFRDQVFVAMEYVDGATLRDWLKASPRSLREVLDVYARAGAGLAAAHAAGLVHRDFKPDNVLVGKDGRVRVTDFGLARAEGEETGTPSHEKLPFDVTAEGLSTPLTRTGALMGTPAYMSYEQHLRQKVDARSDQFSFCVALYEGLYGERPFRADTAAALAIAIARGLVSQPPPGRAVPEWIRRIVVRGLAASPKARWPTMDALLSALARDPRVRAGRVLLGLAAAATVAAAIAFPILTRDDPAVFCRSSERKLAGVWDDDRRAALEKAFLATDRVYAADAAAGATRALDTYAAAWAKARTEACEATRVHGEQSEELLDLRMACLDRRLRDLGALARVLVAADKSVVFNAVRAATALPSLGECANVAALRSTVRPPTEPAARAKLERAAAKVAHAKALLAAGKPEGARPVADEAAKEARAIPYGPLAAEALFYRGVSEARTAKYKEAEATLFDGWREALAAKDDRLATRIAARRVSVLGVRLARYDEAERWGAVAAALLERQGDDAELRADLETQLGLLAFERGRHADALAHHERALRLFERTHEAGDPQVAARYNNLGLAYYRGAGRLHVALEHLRRAQRIGARALGPSHPEVARYGNNVGIVLSDLGEHEAAAAQHRSVLALYERIYGRDHPACGDSHTNLGIALKELRRYGEAIAHYRRAIEIFEARNGKEHPSVGVAKNNLGNALEAAGRAREALPVLAQARAILEKAHGESHAEVANVLLNEGAALRALGRIDEAMARFERTLSIRREAFGKGHPEVAESLLFIGETLLRGDDEKAASAIAHLERAAEILGASAAFPDALARARFALARALARARPDARPRARALAQAARSTFERNRKAHGPQLREIRDWLGQLAKR